MKTSSFQDFEDFLEDAWFDNYKTLFQKIFHSIMSALKRYTNHEQEDLNDGHSSFSLPSSFDGDLCHVCLVCLSAASLSTELGIADVQRIFCAHTQILQFF